MTLLGGAMAWPLAARAQQPPLPNIGYLGVGTADANPHLMTAFFEGLQNTGYIPDRNVAIIYRWAEGDYGRLPGLAAVQQWNAGGRVSRFSRVCSLS